MRASAQHAQHAAQRADKGCPGHVQTEELALVRLLNVTMFCVTTAQLTQACHPFAEIRATRLQACEQS